MTEGNKESFDIVLFEGPSTLQPGEAETHGLMGVVGRVFGRPLQDVEADWNRVLGQVSSILESAIPGSFNGYDLDTVSIALGFNAKGGLVFIAEAGIQVSVTVTFKRVL
jgi:hypothetical protein